MEDLALKTLQSMLETRGRKGIFEAVGGPLDETIMYTFDSILIIFSKKSKVSSKEFEHFLEFASENSHTGGILIITPSRPSEAVLTLLRSHIAIKENQFVQIFELRHLQFDISKHRKVPHHRILEDTEEADVIRKYGNPTQFPKIDSQDAMAKWIGARPSNIIEITGLCETSIDNLRYRYCVADVING